ncbi:CST complex subunit TEN1 isoform X2 [Mastomys coucha]|nr:CST complex subunit TEN1 isoform X2 [Mastomys coucha]
MLPKPGIYYFPWEIRGGQVPEGSTLRTFGRLYLYDMARSLVTLAAPQKPDQCQLLVCTNLVEPFEAHVNFLYMVLGELERMEGCLCLCHPGCPGTCHREQAGLELTEIFQQSLLSVELKGGAFVVRARLLTCVEGMDLSLLEKAILEQRLHLQKRQQPVGDTSILQAPLPAPQPIGDASTLQAPPPAPPTSSR